MRPEVGDTRNDCVDIRLCEFESAESALARGHVQARTDSISLRASETFTEPHEIGGLWAAYIPSRAPSPHLHRTSYSQGGSRVPQRESAAGGLRPQGSPVLVLHEDARSCSCAPTAPGPRRQWSPIPSPTGKRHQIFLCSRLCSYPADTHSSGHTTRSYCAKSILRTKFGRPYQRTPFSRVREIVCGPFGTWSVSEKIRPSLRGTRENSLAPPKSAH